MEDRKKAIALICLCIVLSPGCASARKKNEGYLGRFVMDNVTRWLGGKKKKKGFDPDPLWHAGYGFNNPNPERMRNGQPLLNFDGSVAD